MKLAEAIPRFLDHARLSDSRVPPHLRTAFHDQALLFLTDYFPVDAIVSEITPSNLRDFLSRWYVERACASKPNDSKSFECGDATSTAGLPKAQNDQVPEPPELLDSLERFLKWADQQVGANQFATVSPILIELRQSLPRALEITNTLTRALRERGGAFNFPEFLTSFEEGGSSQYDIDAPGNVGAIDGYFRIIRVEGASVEAQELISEETVWPIAFPLEVAARLEAGYIINLEVVRTREGWQIAGCGFAYPPGKEIG